MMKKLLLILALLLFLPLAFSAPQTQSFDNELIIETLQYEYHPYNTTYYLHAHIHSGITGVRLNPLDVTCNYHLYAEYDNWRHVNTGVLAPFGAGVFVDINASEFFVKGEYAIMMWCESLDTTVNPAKLFGGFVRYFFTVNDEGTPSTLVKDKFIADNFLFLIVLIFLLMASVYIGNYAVMLFSGILFIFAPFAYDYTFGIIPTSLSILAFMLIGVALIFQAISYYLTEKKGKR